MRAYLAIALFVGVASAWPQLFQYQNQRTQAGVSREQLLERELKLLTLLERLQEPSTDVEIKSISDSFIPDSNSDLYNDGGEGATHLVNRFNAGKTRGRGLYFSLFDENQRNEMICLFNCLMNAKTWDTYFKVAAWARERLNEGLFAYALIASASHRADLRGVKFPAPYEINPHFFVPTEVIQEAYRAQMKQTPKTITAGFTGTAKNSEQRVAYFGEDVGLEAHHFHWHIDFPFWWDSAKYGVKDRKGELFFYMHHQLNARFDAERLSNNLERVKPLGWNEELEEGFAPHATYLREGEFPARPDNMKFQDLPEVSLADMNRFTNRILDAVDKLSADGTDQSVSLNNPEGIDILGSMIESSTSSPNPKYYGSIHNFCHMLLARITDPDGKYGLPPGVMEHFETSTRDPTFFRLHKFLDEIFRVYKNNLGPYSKDEVNFDDVAVTAVRVSTQGKGTESNNLVTFFDDFEFDLNNALDHVADREDIEIKTSIKRLNYEPFKYSIVVQADAPKTATFRVFLAPKYESYGDEIPLDDKRWQMIELDKFVVKLTAGENTVERSSVDSSVTIPDTLSFKTLKQQALDGINGDENVFKLDENFRHCGLPDRLLLPKGTPEGMDFELWVVVSDWEQDKVTDAQEDFEKGGSVSYCGQPQEKFPDKRAMGYPWDRPIANLDDFVTPNIKKVDIKITHQ